MGKLFIKAHKSTCVNRIRRKEPHTKENAALEEC